LAVSLPDRSALGAQIAAAPSSQHVAVLAACLVPVGGGLVLVAPSLLAFTVSLATALERDAAAGVALALGILAAVPAGGILAEGVLAASRSARRQAALVVTGTLAWAVLGWMLGAATLGPLAPATTTLRDGGPPWPACAASCGSLFVLAACWILLAARRPERRPATRGTSTKLVRGRRGVLPVTFVALLVRRADVQLASAGAVAFGLGGVALAAVAKAPAPAPFLLGTSTGLLGAVVASLAVCGVIRGGGWLWLSAPGDTARIARAAVAVALALTSLPVVAIGAAAIVVSSASWGAIGMVAVVVWLATDVAVVAGVVAPWRGGAGEQLSTFAAFGAIAMATSLAVGVVAPRLVAVGAPDAVVAVGLCCAGAAGATLALRRGFEGARS